MTIKETTLASIDTKLDALQETIVDLNGVVLGLVPAIGTTKLPELSIRAHQALVDQIKDLARTL